MQRKHMRPKKVAPFLFWNHGDVETGRTCTAARAKCCASSLSRWSVKLLFSLSFLISVMGVSHVVCVESEFADRIPETKRAGSRKKSHAKAAARGGARGRRRGKGRPGVICVNIFERKRGCTVGREIERDG